jgi:hypothetical protein
MKVANPTDDNVESFEVMDGVSGMVKGRIAATRWTEISRRYPNSLATASLDWEMQLNSQIAIGAWVSANSVEELVFIAPTGRKGIAAGDRLNAFGEVGVSLRVVSVDSRGCQARRIPNYPSRFADM